MSVFATGGPCPCGSATSYDACCGRLHRGEAEAETAEQLMRARYSAYAVGDADYLFRSWHPRTRPPGVFEPEQTRWRALQIHSVRDGGVGEPEGVVEFTASYESDAGPGELHERSRFVRRAGRWVYLDGEMV
ncbi:YchJ family metal-binding protein [Luteipulveratus sp. YIM 133132]|uniref:YchJ family protein n=1 Tax=Luteipulveratus flavus TaxID=3031728 RepID=UPI0023AEEBBC|nr:YchJ family metal-binding protein [Luteipulveratus sp. YIM 133132]MDE9366079.1 YchJ family metal-binding protein [Luteipulveratus sp. YIM 133132]